MDVDGRSVALFCERCAPPGATPIGRVTTIRAVRVSCEIVFAGVSLDAATARDEAVKTLQVAVGIAGGLVTVSGVTAPLSRHHRGAMAPREPHSFPEG